MSKVASLGFLLLLLSGCEARLLLRQSSPRECGTLAMSRNLPPAKAVAMMVTSQASYAVPLWLKKFTQHSSGGSSGGALRRPSRGQGASAARRVSSSQYRSAQSLRRDDVWIFSSYHKTGTVLIQEMLSAFNGNNHSAVWHVDKALCKGADLFANRMWGNSYSHPAIPVVQTLQKYRFVHFIRNPVNIVVSAYRYHVEGRERWLYVKQIREADDAETARNLEVVQKLLSDFGLTEAERRAITHFHQAAEAGLTTLDYYRAAPEEEGIVVQAFHSWPDIDLLLRNYDATRGDPNALQMRMESVQEDFKRSMSCMFQFLHESKPFNMDDALRTVAPLDVSTHPQSHVTSGRYDNTKIRKVLEKMTPLHQAQLALQRPAAREC